MSIWAVRALRLWLVLFVPLTLFLGYYAVNSSIEIAEGHREVRTWIEAEREREVRGQRGPLSQTDVQFKMLERDYVRLNERKNVSLVILLGALVVPAVVLLLAKVANWIWRPEAAALAATCRPTNQHNVLSNHLRVYWWILGIGVSLVASFYLAPERTVQSLISGGIQAVGFGVIGWVIFRVSRRKRVG